MKSATWNPWHGCHKLSEGCRHCYVYREDFMFGTKIGSHVVRKTASFGLPLRRKRDKSYKIAPGTVVFTCFTSDFFIEEADEWRAEAWQMIKTRADLTFFIITKRIDRLTAALPDDWGVNGYANVAIGCTVENQDRADYRLPIFLKSSIAHKSIMVAPMLEAINLKQYLTPAIEEVSVSGESGLNARTCDYRWVLDIRRQCLEAGIPFSFHQTGSHLLMNGRIYHIPRPQQIAQAQKAAIDTISGR